MDWAIIIPLITTALVTVIGAVGALVVPVILARMKDARDAAVAAVEAAEATAKTTTAKLEDVGAQLDGRLTEYKNAMAEAVQAALAKVDAALAKVDAAFERGRQVGFDEATTGPIAQRIEGVEAHLEAQDLVSEARHEEAIKNGSVKK